MRIFKGFLRLCVGIGALTLLASYFGALHPLGDSLAVFRDWIAYGVACLGVVALLAGLWRLGTGVGVAAGAALLHIASFGAQQAPVSVPEVVVYSKNLGAGRTDWGQLGEDIDAVDADIILLQEVTQQRMAELPSLLPNHPFQHICNFSGWSAMAVLSRWPLSEGGCTAHRSLAYATVDTPAGPIWAASIHQVWPYPYDQAVLLPDILAVIPGPGTRQVIGGDFNMVPWGHSLRAIARAGETQRIGPVQPTIEVRGLGLPIDHVLTDGQGEVVRRARLGSDHYGLAARIVWE